MSEEDIYYKKFTEKAKKNTTLVIVLGVLMIILGFGLLSYTFATNIAAMYLIGIFVVIAGLLQFFNAFNMYEGVNAIFWAIIGILYVIAGVLTIIHPLVTSFILTTFIAVAFILVGVFRIISSIKLRPFNGWQWSLFAGVISTLTGILIIATPGSFTWVIGLFIAIDIIFQGVIYTTIGFSIRSITKTK